ncbi:MAG: CRISPR-associated helicase Cas3' [Oscillospiraceae bacterium]|nr:CRISPR-associated helicase Cas3' [Oscillospiraceae bacterium]
MKYIAHKFDDNEQLLTEHLTNVAELSRENAVYKLKDIAYICGLLHDAGKYTELFQKRIRGADIRVEHARYGARVLSGKNGVDSIMQLMMQYCIAGHHSGIPDGGTRLDSEDMSTLHGLLKRKTEDFSEFKREIIYELPNDAAADYFKQMKSPEEVIELFAFLTRYLYSCLTDADFLDTEHFYSPDIERGMSGDFAKALDRVCEKLDGFKPDTDIKKARNVLQEQVYKNIAQKSDIYTLDMPTGSGKTLCSIKAALQKAVSEGKKRIIYVIPYVSIIEQTAEICEDIFGDVLPVLQHHSNYDFAKDESDDESTEKKLRRTCENWGAPFIITTNVQFFESLYNCKSSRMRKLHNLADSVIVFDEIHMLPIKYIQPCMRAIGYVTKYLNSTAIMMSATMPDYKSFITEYAGGCNVVDLITDRGSFSAFKKCKYHYIGFCGAEKIAFEAAKYGNALIVANSRRGARKIYEACGGKKYYLSTYMMPEHRSKVIGKIRTDLVNGEKLIVVSTSLIEAGVDLDFKCVFRENAGLDNIIQSAGRCNREGLMPFGDVYIFETENLKGDMQMKANITRSLFEEYGDISCGECIKEYYRRLFKLSDKSIEKNTITEYMVSMRPDSIPFRTYSDSFKFIDNTMIAVVIPNKENKNLIDELQYGKLSNKRKLQRHSASVYFYEFESLFKQGVIKEINGVYILSNSNYYDEKLGLMLENDKLYIF